MRLGLLNLLLFTNLMCQFCFGQPKCRIEHYSTEDGLSHAGLTCIIKDHEGFMWFGSWDGINRFDGHSFVSYKSKPGDMSQLKNDRIDQIVDDGGTSLWLKAYDDQVYKFDKRSEQFIPLENFFSKHFGNRLKFKKILQATTHDLWLQTIKDGLVYFPNTDKSLHSYIKFDCNQSSRHRLPSNHINFFHTDKRGVLWIGTERGLVALSNITDSDYHVVKSESSPPVDDFVDVTEGQHQLFFITRKGNLVVFNKANKKFKTVNISSYPLNCVRLSRRQREVLITGDGGTLFKVNLGDLKTQEFKYRAEPFYTFFEDVSGNIWLEPAKKGVVKFDPVTRRFNYYSQPNDADYNNIGNHFKVYEDNKGIVWVNMKGGGFGYYNPLSDRIEYFYNGPDPSSHRFSNIISALYYDPAGILWFITDERGLDKVVFEANDFNQHLLVSNSFLKSDNEVRSLCCDRKNRLWLGAKSGKLYVLQNGARLQNLFINVPKEGLGLVYTIMQDSDGNVWLGTKANGLFKAEPINAEETKYKLTHYLPDNGDRNSINSKEIYTIIEDSKKRIWVGSFDAGLSLLVKDNNQTKFLHISNLCKNYPTGTFQKIRHLAEGPTGNIWIGTTDGLAVLKTDNLNNLKLKTYRKVPGNKNSLGNNDVQFIYRDKKNTMWIATAGGGLDCALGDPLGHLTFKDYTIDEGLSNNCVLSCVQDNAGYLWMATQKGLSRFNTQTSEFRNYNSIDGLPHAFFSEGAVRKLRNDLLVFGLSKGYLTFAPESIKDYPIRSNIAFTNLQVNNEDAKPQLKGVLTSNINNTDAIVLKYNQNTISIDYTTLDFRSSNKQNYVYRLTGFDSLWRNNKEQRRVTFTNLPAGKYLFQVKCLSSDLYSNIPSKSLAVTILPPPWLTWWAYLIYGVVIVTLSFIAIRIALTMLRLRQRVSVEQKLAELKLTFFTNISHELRTPLTLILNPIQEILKKEQLSVQGQQYASVVKRNADRMVQFINQLLDLRKSQSGKTQLRVSRIDLVSFVQNISRFFTEAAREKEIMIDIVADEEYLYVWADAEKMDTVLYNVISNALKFSPERGKISIRLGKGAIADEVNIIISDEGPGVPQEKLEDIFELYYEGGNVNDGNYKGTGIGLALSKELIKAHKGKIIASNNEKCGLSVTIMLPGGKTHFSSVNTVIIDDPEVPINVDKAIAELLYPGGVPFATQCADASAPLLLLVEDNPDLQIFLQAQLSEFYKVELADNGQEGLEMAQKLSPDLIISDIMMPRMNGIEMLDKLKHETSTSHIPVVLLSARTSIESQIEALKYGADYYITKPFHNQFLLQAVSTLLEKRKKLFEIFVDQKKIIQLEPGELVITHKDEQFLKEVVRIVEERMVDTNFNIDAVAAQLGMGRSTFFKKFKSLTNIPPVEFVRDIRLKRGKQYLDAGETNISVVAYAVGFSNGKYFSTCFREKFGLSPTEYLKSRPVNQK